MAMLTQEVTTLAPAQLAGYVSGLIAHNVIGGRKNAACRYMPSEVTPVFTFCCRPRLALAAGVRALRQAFVTRRLPSPRRKPWTP